MQDFGSMPSRSEAFFLQQTYIFINIECATASDEMECATAADSICIVAHNDQQIDMQILSSRNIVLKHLLCLQLATVVIFAVIQHY